MTHPKYNNLTPAELLSAVQIARLHSPIIEELAKRFEKTEFGESDALAETEEAAQKPRAFACPVCEAELLGSLVLIDDCFSVKVNQ